MLSFYINSNKMSTPFHTIRTYLFINSYTYFYLFFFSIFQEKKSPSKRDYVLDVPAIAVSSCSPKRWRPQAVRRCHWRSSMGSSMDGGAVTTPNTQTRPGPEIFVYAELRPRCSRRWPFLRAALDNDVNKLTRLFRASIERRRCAGTAPRVRIMMSDSP